MHFFCFMGIRFCSRETLKQSSKYQFADGFYKTTLNDRRTSIYVLTGSDTIKANKKPDLGHEKIDSTKAILIVFPYKKPDKFSMPSSSAKTIDVDVSRVLIKYRPPANGFPPTLECDF